MLINYIKTALRSLLKQRVYTLINIVGLSVGIASCILIVLYITHEFSYDQYFEKKEQIYNVVLERKYPNHATNYAVVPHSYADVITQDFPEVEATLKVTGPINQVMVAYEDNPNDIKQFEENFILAADSNFFDFFNIPFIRGDARKALRNKTDVVITQQTAQRYFGNADPIGKVLKIFNEPFTITGVCRNVPENTHFKFDFLTKWNEEFYADGIKTNFTTFTVHLYLMLQRDANAQALEARFPAMVDTYAAAQIESELGKSWAEYKRAGNGYRYFLRPLTAIHLDPLNIEARLMPGGNVYYVYFLICAACLILSIAGINFMNLATARSAERAREVGVRKAMGSVREQLIAQFLTEALILSCCATILAVILARLALPAFNNLANQNLIMPWGNPVFTGAAIAVAAIVGLLAGSYPAFALSSFNIIAVMKSNFTGSSKGAGLRNGLVVFQFFISVVLIVGTIVVDKQMRYMQQKSLGYNKEQILVIERSGVLEDKAQTFIEQLKTQTGIINAAGSFSFLGQAGNFFGIQFTHAASSEVFTAKAMNIDDNFAETLGINMLQGKAFSKETHDSLSIILNETAVKTLGIEDPIGKQLVHIEQRNGKTVPVSYTITGIVQDFNFQSLRDPVTPLVMISNDGQGAGFIYVRVKENELPAAIASIQGTWRTFTDRQPIQFRFLDESLNAQYDAEQRAGKIFAVFSSLAIIIACVGLFGLSAYTASLRTREIGIRKVLGASAGNIMVLLSKDFARLILLALVLAVPLAWYTMDRWLQSFAYRTALSIDVFIIAGITALFIAGLTVSYHALKAAMVNPVKSLRSQ